MMEQCFKTNIYQSAVAAFLRRRSSKFLLLLTRIKDLGSEAALYTVPSIAGNDLTHLHQLVDVSGQQLKRPVHVAVALGRRLDVADAQLSSKLLRLVPAHLAFLVQVALMADQDVDHVVRQDVLTHLLVPLSHVVKGFAVGQVED